MNKMTIELPDGVGTDRGISDPLIHNPVIVIHTPEAAEELKARIDAALAKPAGMPEKGQQCWSIMADSPRPLLS